MRGAAAVCVWLAGAWTARALYVPYVGNVRAAPRDNTPPARRTPNLTYPIADLAFVIVCIAVFRRVNVQCGP